MEKTNVILPPPRSLPEMINSIMERKRIYALAAWAVQKMGKNAERYLVQADRQFNTLLNLRLIVYDGLGTEHVTSEKLLSAMQETPFDIPLRLKKRAKRYDPFRLRKEYEKYIEVVTRIKKKRGKREIIAFALIENLPGIPWNHAYKYAGKDYKAHEIALDYVAWRNNMWKKKHPDLLATDALEKYLAIVRSPKKLKAWMKKEQDRSGWPLEHILILAGYLGP